MDKPYVAKASVKVLAPISKVWSALIGREAIKDYMFGADVVSDWEEGSKISWKGVWQGKSYDDRGEILQVIPEKLLQYNHFSPSSGLPGLPENYQTVTIKLEENDDNVLISLSQDNNKTEQAREHSEKNWILMLESLKKYLEQ